MPQSSTRSRTIALTPPSACRWWLNRQRWLPGVYAESTGVYTNNAVGGAFRGFGTTQAAFAGEIQIDRLAEQLGLDPIDFRRRNALKVGDTTATGQVLESSSAFDETLAAVKEGLARLVLPVSGARKKIGVGIASAYKNVGMGGGNSG
jgi:CO/xanthine dehydrogenase Mo-binding subunit